MMFHILVSKLAIRNFVDSKKPRLCLNLFCVANACLSAAEFDKFAGAAAWERGASRKYCLCWEMRSSTVRSTASNASFI